MATASNSAKPATSASASASASSNTVAEPPLVDPSGKPLAQTKDEPNIDNPLFRQRLEQLWDAIVHNDVERARSFFFPVEAYKQVKGIKKPERDWKYRLFKAYKRDVRKYHRLLGKSRAKAKLLRIELRNKPKWMKPGSEGNLIGYWRVTRSYLHFVDGDGKKRRFDLTSMISWRGQWYVVHVHGFK